jgi:hypothetical protein
MKATAYNPTLRTVGFEKKACRADLILFTAAGLDSESMLDSSSGMLFVLFLSPETCSVIGCYSKGIITLKTRKSSIGGFILRIIIFNK